jgi:hypothetical protein
MTPVLTYFEERKNGLNNIKSLGKKSGSKISD